MYCTTYFHDTLPMDIKIYREPGFEWLDDDYWLKIGDVKIYIKDPAFLDSLAEKADELAATMRRNAGEEFPGGEETPGGEEVP